MPSCSHLFNKEKCLTYFCFYPVFCLSQQHAVYKQSPAKLLLHMVASAHGSLIHAEAAGSKCMTFISNVRVVFGLLMTHLVHVSCMMSLAAQSSNQANGRRTRHFKGMTTVQGHVQDVLHEKPGHEVSSAMSCKKPIMIPM